MSRKKSQTLSGPVRVMRIIARLNIGGPAIHVSLATAGLQDTAFASLLVTGLVGQAEGDMAYLPRELGVEPIILPELGREISLFDDLRALVALVCLMRQVRPHVVHTHTAKAGFLGRLAARLSGVPVVIHTYHGHVFYGYFPPIKTRIFVAMEQLAALLSDVILTISASLRDDLLRFRIASANKIRIVPLGLNLSPMITLSELRGRFRSEMGYRSDTPLVVIVGRLAPVKNHELFLAAAQRVARIMPQARFVIVGDGERRDELEVLVKQLGLADVVHFTGWRRDLSIIYADASVVVLTSRNEGTPVSILEAMAACVPVVATAVGGVADVLRSGQFGTLVTLGDPNAVADAIVDVLCAKRGSRVVEASDWVLKQYDSKRLIKDLRELYIELLSQKGYVSEQKEGYR